MSVVDLHPEELLEKDARGTLRDSEKIRLDAHVERCKACRLERAMRADFARELEEDVKLPSLSAILEGASIGKKAEASGDAHARADAPVEDAPRAPRAPLAPARRAPRKATTWLLVAAAMLGVSAAAGATGLTGLGARVWTRLVGATSTDTLAPPAATTVKPAPKKPPPHASAPVEAPAEAPAPVPEIASAVVPAPPPAPAPVAPRPAAHREASARPRASEAAVLFDEAASARRRGDYARAALVHRELESRFPRSAEAQVSRATLGRLLLDRGDPGAALASFDRYLASGSGPLGEDVMAGRATALERLGRADDARRAWSALLAAYPATAYAAHAKARVAADE